MTLLKQTCSRTAIAMLCGLVISLTASRADESNKRTILTVSQTVQIGDATLQPGRYVVKLLDSQSERHVVQIFNGDQTHIIDTVIAVPIQRVTPRGHTTFTYYETPAGSAHALRTWYYPGDSVGQEFLEPKHHEMLAAGTAVVDQPLAFNNEETPASSATVTQAGNEQPSAAEPTTGQQSGDQQSADRSATGPAPAQTEVAQNTTPAPTNDTAAQSPAPANQPATQLPQTGSSYPEIGLFGLMLLGLAGLSRVTRRA